MQLYTFMFSFHMISSVTKMTFLCWCSDKKLLTHSDIFPLLTVIILCIAS